MDPLPPGNTIPPTPFGITSSSAGSADFIGQTIVVKLPGAGMTVFNRYKLDRVLGRGGMGVVWLADDLKLERPVALKFLPSLIGLDPAAVRELKSETRRGLELSHPHIVRIYDFVDDDDAAAISMEFVNGQTLSELRLATPSGVFAPAEVSKWLLGVCDALDYAHFQRKLIHRDLKPANIMLTNHDAVAKIADFGIARSLADTMSRLSAAHMAASGTLPYMSPQQAMGERPMPTDDVYSLGATLYELFTGKPPFYRGDLPMQINSKVPPTIQQRREELEVQASEELPADWERAIAACLSKNPHDRPSCAGELAEMLGLKPLTNTSRVTPSRPSAGSNPASSDSVKPRTRLLSRSLAIAAAVTLIGSGAVWILKQSPGTNKPAASASATPAALASGSVKAQSKAATPEVKPVTAEAKQVEGAKPQPKTMESASKFEPKSTPSSVPEMKPAPSAPLKKLPTPTVAVSSSKPAVSVPPTPSALLATSPQPAVSMAANPAPAPVVAAAATTQAPPAVIQPPAPRPIPPLPAAAAAQPAGPPLPPGFNPPPEFLGQIQNQPLVADPSSGFWAMEQMFPTLPFSSYSAAGKKHLLFKAQSLLKEKGLYTSTVDGKEGKGTHNAIQLFQAKSGLKPTGLLDLPTLIALQLSSEPDNLTWTAPSSSTSGSRGTVRRAPGGGRYAPQTEEQPSFFERKLRTLLGEDD